MTNKKCEEKKSMESKINYEITRIKDRFCQFYYRGIGQVIKRRRLELKMTQETVAMGLLSNTYLSKIENNQIVANRDHLYLIMERMDIDINKISFPEEMWDYLQESIKLFFYRDLKNYKVLIDKLNDYNFSILLQIIKLGYYTLNGDYENAKPIYNEIYRYLVNLEEYGFSVFLVYSSFYNIAVNNFKNARILIERVENHFQNDEMMYGLLNHAKFMVYGNLHLTTTASEAGQLAINIFNKYSNISRLNEIYLFKQVFTVYDGNFKDFHLNLQTLDFVSDKDANIYLIIIASQSEEPLKYLEHLRKEKNTYLLGLFYKAKWLLASNRIDEYKIIYNQINDLHYEYQSRIDYCNILKLMKNEEDSILKEYLIDTVLPFATEKQSIYFMQVITKIIVDTLSKKKRYKDALTYRKKLDDSVLSFQSDSRIIKK